MASEGILEPRVGAYLERLAQHDHSVLREMEALAAASDFPIVGPECGRLLHQLARMSAARRVFEMGSGFGYSTLWFAAALPPGGRVVHTDGDPENSRRAHEFLTRAGLADRVQFETGDAREILARTPGEFDVIFIDIDKEQYPDAYALARDRVRVGGVVAIHNALWSGRVADPAVTGEPATQGVREYLRRMWADPAFVSSLLPLDDGMAVSVRVA
ncbi:MAG TPA: O-methyltransferase [Candidatus Saccharimonadales bacterium]|nr:O-methyltransferase [Candidatus Saccharimonadales bacterium]